MFIGYYNLANLVTLLGLASSVMACFVSVSYINDPQKIKIAVALFLFSGLCDMFDGRIARGAGSRGRKQKLFGIQIDTVCDMVSFGITPVVIAYCLGFKEIYSCAVYVLYACCAAIRLAYFNTQAVEETPDLNMKAFTGVPVPFSCLILPPLMMLFSFCALNVVKAAFLVLYFITGIAFIFNVKIKKMNIIQSIVLIAAELLCVTLMFVLKTKQCGL